MNGSFHRLQWLFCFILALAVSISALAEPLPFRRAMELVAQRGSASVAAAEQVRARAAYLETRNMFLPQLVVGSGLAKTYGFPLSIEGSAPSVISVNYQSSLYSPAGREFMKAAQQEWQASETNTQEQRAVTLLEAAITYIQLDTVASRMRLLNQQQEEANRLLSVVNDRVRAGVDSQMDLTRAKLAAAQVRLRLADAEGAADVLRERLAQLTGVPATSIETVTESIPRVPDLSQAPDIIGTAVSSSPVLKSAMQDATAKEFRAKGEHRVMLPAIDLVGQYGLFSRYNNYDLYFNRFQRNNATLGVAIRFPLLNFAQRARAEAADAEAVKAQRQTEVTKRRVSTDTLKLARAIKQLDAAEQVAQLDYQLAQAQVDAVQARIQTAAPGLPGAPGQPAVPPPGPRELESAQIQLNDKYSTYLDTGFELQKARLQLLRAAGKLDDWALGKQ
ncbi:MAG: TolC family protein [Terriglobales bacterium]|jgi:outer membrane protein TolC